MNASVDDTREDEPCGVGLTRPSSGSACELVVSSNGTYDDGSDSAPGRGSRPWHDLLQENNELSLKQQLEEEVLQLRAGISDFATALQVERSTRASLEQIICERDRTVAQQEQVALRQEQMIGQRNQAIMQRDRFIAELQNKTLCAQELNGNLSRCAEKLADVIRNLIRTDDPEGEAQQVTRQYDEQEMECARLKGQNLSLGVERARMAQQLQELRSNCVCLAR